MSAARTERLLNLLTLLLNTRRSISLREMREMEEFRAYCTLDPKSGERAFERDKASLIEAGVPLRWMSPEEIDDEEGIGGYVIERDRYYLPELSLSPTDLAMLSMAGAAAAAIDGFPGRAAVHRALGKLGFDVQEAESLQTLAHAPLRAGTDEKRVAAHLDVLHDAVARRCQADMTYRGHGAETTKRRVDPYGLFYRQGYWYLVGHCHLRGDQRTFHLGRIDSVEIARGQKRNGYFDVPEDFDIEALSRRRPWSYAQHAPTEVKVRLAERLVPAIPEIFGDDVEVESTGGGAHVTLMATNMQAVAETVLPFGAAAQVVAPLELRDQVRRVYEGLADRYAADLVDEQGGAG